MVQVRLEHREVQHAADHRLRCQIGAGFRDMQLGVAEVAEVADERRKLKANEEHQREDVIGEICRVGVIPLGRQVRLLVRQAARYTGVTAHANVRRLCAERHVLIRDVGVEKIFRLGAALRVDVTRAFSSAPARKGCPSDEEVVPSPQFSANGWQTAH